MPRIANGLLRVANRLRPHAVQAGAVPGGELEEERPSLPSTWRARQGVRSGAERAQRVDAERAQGDPGDYESASAQGEPGGFVMYGGTQRPVMHELGDRQSEFV